MDVEVKDCRKAADAPDGTRYVCAVMQLCTAWLVGCFLLQEIHVAAVCLEEGFVTVVSDAVAVAA